MIAIINGRLIHKSPDSAIVDVGGVGYEVFIPLSTFYSLPEVNDPVFLQVHTHLKEDAIQLYGFFTKEEKELFRLLLSVGGVGPKLARNILSGMAVSDLTAALAASDKARISSIPGVGAKTAERLILELKDKVAKLAAPAPAGAGAGSGDPVTVDVVSALENLGYKAAAAEEAVKKAKDAAGGLVLRFEGLFKESLKRLSKK